MAISLGFSPCPNDTFIFDALVNKKIDTEGLDFDVQLEDVQTLNEWAKAGKLDISKISYGVLPLVLQQYKVLNSGGALGMGVGPLLISNKEIAPADLEAAINNNIIAIPGINTTAHLLFSLAFPKATKKQFFVFNEIENAVLSGHVTAGVIIHENRFTYQDKGLVKLIDLGAYWEEKLHVPIPLGGIIAHERIGKKTALQIDTLIKKSIEFAFAHYPQLTDYIREHAQEMSETVMRKHIDLYVNNFSLDLGEEGKKAVLKLLEIYHQNVGTVFIDTGNID
ncbi:1,4-dihydroxy-6-naphthoate synthase [Parasediminibacterium sp. JCM 36343]|uniref:1,4-dihydroxy-6-naphthoate synthase n=1 Tax=Parasediminibacterium sp. JCM 36343 TaxID=3374279 RepID=UPI003979ECE8